MLKKKPDDAHHQTARDVFQMLSFHQDHPILMGSSGLKDIDHPADFDLFEVVYSDTDLNNFKTTVKNGLMKLGRRIKDADDVYFIAFKAKGDTWTLQQLVDGDRLQSILDEKSMIKVDVAAWIGSRFVPFSNVFEFRFSYGRGINREKETRESIESLMEDVAKFKRDGQYWKALKRLFVVATIGKKTSTVTYLKRTFNSDLGKLAKITSDLDTARQVWDRYKTKKQVKARMREALQTLKAELGTVSDLPVPEKWFKEFDLPPSVARMKRLYNQLSALVQSEAKKKMP